MPDDDDAVPVDFGHILDALPGLVLTTQADGRCDYANRGWSEYTGFDRNETVDLGWQAAVHPDDLTPFQEAFGVIRQLGVAKDVDVRLRRADGEYRWYVLRSSVSGVSTADESHDPRWCWLATYADEEPTTDARVRRLLDMLPIRCGMLNKTGELEFSNLESHDITLGTTLEKLQNWQASQVMLVDDYPRHRAKIAALLTTGEMFDDEVRMRHRDGVYRWARARALPIRNAQGHAVRYISCQIDIDDLKHAEALLAAEVKLLEMVARGEDLPLTLDALACQVEYLCVGCICNVLVVAPDRTKFELAAGPGLPDTHRDILHGMPIDGGHDPCSLSIIRRQSVLTEDLAHDPRWQGSDWARLMRTEGYATCWSMPIMSGALAPSGVFAIYRREPAKPTPREQEVIDRFTKIAGIAISRSQAAANLQAREYELREALAQLTQGQRLSKTGSFTSDIQPDVQRWSDELYRIYEIDPAIPATTTALRERVHPEDLALFNAEIQRRIEGQESDFIFRIVTPSGRVKHLRAVVRLMEHVAGRPIFMGAVQDITESKLADEALTQARSELAHVARVATLNAMTASIAHEVNQPLSGILTNANTCVRMLAADPPNLVGAAETARRTIRDANRASEVISRLRAMFSTKAPTMDLADINDVAREVIALSTGELRRSGALLQSEFADDLPAVRVDRVQVQQVMLNLMLNAADAMAAIEGRPRSLTLRTEVYGQDSVRFLVRDAGVGVDPEAVEGLFAPFYTTKEKGMGVGLSISRSIIESHKGRIWAEANDGPGATFSFCIPAAAAELTP